MADKPVAVLRATEEVVNDIKRFTDTPIAKELLVLFDYRRFAQNGLLPMNERFAPYDHEADFFYWELSELPELLGKLSCDSEEMIKEITFLYKACSADYYKNVEFQLMEYVTQLKSLYQSEDALIYEAVRKSGRRIMVRYRGGQKAITESEADYSSLSISQFEMYYKIEYFYFMSLQISAFIKNISPFVKNKLDREHLIPNLPARKAPAQFSKEELERIHREQRNDRTSAEEKMKLLFRDNKYSEFEEYCRLRLTKPLLSTKNNPSRDPVIETQDGRMEWLGVKSGPRNVKLESLGHFIQLLLHKSYLRKGQDIKDYAQAFIPYFFEKQMDTKSLAQEIKIHQRFAMHFPDLK